MGDLNDVSAIKFWDLDKRKAVAIVAALELRRGKAAVRGVASRLGWLEGDAKRGNLGLRILLEEHIAVVKPDVLGLLYCLSCRNCECSDAEG